MAKKSAKSAKNGKQGEGGGQPTQYRSEYNNQAYKLTLLGAIDKELADFFGVTEKTIDNWKKKYPKFLQSLKSGKSQADAEVAEKLYHRAKGYEHVETKVFCNDGVITTYEVIKHYPPETAAICFWLKNRQKKLWRDQTNLVLEDENTLTDAECEEIKKLLSKNDIKQANT